MAELLVGYADNSVVWALSGLGVEGGRPVGGEICTLKQTTFCADFAGKEWQACIISRALRTYL